MSHQGVNNKRETGMHVRNVRKIEAIQLKNNWMKREYKKISESRLAERPLIVLEAEIRK